MSKLFQKIKHGLSKFGNDANKMFSKGGAGHQIFRKIANTVKEQRPLTDMIANKISEAGMALGAYNPAITGITEQISSGMKRASHGIENNARAFQHTYDKKPKLNSGLERPAKAEAIGDSTLFA